MTSKQMWLIGRSVVTKAAIGMSVSIAFLSPVSAEQSAGATTNYAQDVVAKLEYCNAHSLALIAAAAQTKPDNAIELIAEFKAIAMAMSKTADVYAESKGISQQRVDALFDEMNEQVKLEAKNRAKFASSLVSIENACAKYVASDPELVRIFKQAISESESQ